MMISADYMSVDRDKPQQIEFVREVGPRMSEDAEIFHSDNFNMAKFAL